jgi:hypothetical protein
VTATVARSPLIPSKLLRQKGCSHTTLAGHHHRNLVLLRCSGLPEMRAILHFGTRRANWLFSGSCSFPPALPSRPLSTCLRCTPSVPGHCNANSLACLSCIHPRSAVRKDNKTRHSCSVVFCSTARRNHFILITTDNRPSIYKRLVLAPSPGHVQRFDTQYHLSSS